MKLNKKSFSKDLCAPHHNESSLSLVTNVMGRMISVCGSLQTELAIELT